MRSLLWSVRRELWEHRWVYIVPAVGGGVLVVVLGGALLLPASINIASIAEVFDLAVRMLLLMGTLSTFVYCAEALHSERRDGSIVFWKALPVSDRTTVLGKSTVALVVIPLLTLGTLLVAQAIAHIAALRISAPLTGLLSTPGGVALEVVASALWIAPVYAWMMVVSAWARRAVLLMALLPPFVITVVEAILTGRHTMSRELLKRLVRHVPSGLEESLRAVTREVRRASASELLASPSLWIGVCLAVLLAALVVRMRRTQHAPL